MLPTSNLTRTIASPQPAWPPIAHPPIINNPTTLPLPRKFIQGRTRRTLDIYSAAISSELDGIGDDEHPERQYEFTADYNRIFSWFLEPVFMRYLVINPSFYTQYVERTQANTENSRGLTTKIYALYKRLKAQCLGSIDMKSYMSCWHLPSRITIRLLIYLSGFAMHFRCRVSLRWNRQCLLGQVTR